MTSVHAVSAGHPGSGRDGRRGDREKVAGTGENLRTIGQFDWCMHQLEMLPGQVAPHDCLENEVRDQRACPPIERKA